MRPLLRDRSHLLGATRGVRMRPLLLALLLSACGNGFVYDETICGQHVAWGSQRDRDHDEFSSTIRECEVVINQKFDLGASILWVPGQSIQDCKYGDGCYYAFDDMINLLNTSTIHRSALCHELLHRQLWLDTGDADRDHKNPNFAILDHLSGR